LLRATVAVRGGRQLRWFSVDDPQPVICWESGPLGGPLPPAAHQDLRREIGVRFHIRTNGGASELTVQFHHACCDGMGGGQFIEDLLLSYAQACGDPPAQYKLAPLDSRKLQQRWRFGLTIPALLRMAPRQLMGALGGWRLITRSPEPLIPERRAPNRDRPSQGYPATLHHLFDEETTALARRTSQRLGATLNDLLARDLFLALARWRSRQNLDGDGHWLRMAIPVNLRTPEDGLLPAANVIGNAFLDRRGPDFVDADRLLQGIHEEMGRVKRGRLGLAYIVLANVFRLLPGGLKRKLRADQCVMSCMLTNLGASFIRLPRLDDRGRGTAGNVALDDLDFVAPIRPYSCVTLGIATCARKLGITLHYDLRFLTERQAADLFETYVGQIRVSMAASPQPVLFAPSSRVHWRRRPSIWSRRSRNDAGRP